MGDSSASDVPTPADDTTTTAAPATDATTAVPSTSDEWSQFNEQMKKLRDDIKACKHWKPLESINVTEGGLYCNDQDGHMFKCSENPLEGNDISSGNCPKSVSDNQGEHGEPAFGGDDGGE